MERSSIPRVAPLLFSKTRSRSGTSTTISRTPSLKKRSRAQSRAEQITPPLTPSTSTENLTPLATLPIPPRAHFKDYLRAIYPFYPPCDDVSCTVTLPLNQGDLVLVHTIHDNGWADGTLLASGTRGWLPTNYCEPYQPQNMERLLRALTTFYEVLQECNACSTSLVVLYNQDYMRGLIASVRYLYEVTDCLNRESPMLSMETGNAGIRRSRKAVLSELSTLVKTAKNLEVGLRESEVSGSKVAPWLDTLTTHAFTMVLRAAKFNDLWTEVTEEQLLNDRIVSLPPPTPPADQVDFRRLDESNQQSYQTDIESDVAGQSDSMAGQYNFVAGKSGSAAEDSDASRERHSREQTSTQQSLHRYSQSGTCSQASQSGRQSTRPASVQTARHSATHRVSWVSKPNTVRNSRLASERLLAAHETFLVLLEGFIGIHLFSRSSNEVLVATHRTVHAGRALMTVVDAVWDRGDCQTGHLEKIRDSMYGRIAELVLAAQTIFKPSDQADGEECIPESMARLSETATSCVRVAGECVGSTRYALELIGDFEFETTDGAVLEGAEIKALQNSNDESFNAESSNGESYNASAREVQNVDTGDKLPIATDEAATLVSNSSDTCAVDVTSEDAITVVATIHLQNNKELPQLPPTINTNLQFPVTSEHREELTPASSVTSSSLLQPLSAVSSAATPITPISSQADHSPMSFTSFASDSSSYEAHSAVSHNGSVGVGSVASCDTYPNSTRNSERSTASAISTRASTPDVRVDSLAINKKFSGSQSTLDEVAEEGEACMFENTYGHELVFNKEGQITGGTLPALVERLTTHDSTPDALFVSTFYLTFRLFCTPIAFTRALIDRFQHVDDNQPAANPVKLRVYNVFKQWMESHWRMDCDAIALDLVRSFATNQLSISLPAAGTRLLQLADTVATASSPLVPRLISSIGKTNTSSAHYISPDEPVPAPVLSKQQSNLLKSWKSGGAFPIITDFYPLEIARQLTLKEVSVFCSILPEELLACEWTKRSGSLAVNVRAMSTLSTDLANFVSDTILRSDDHTKRAKAIKHWVKIGAKCLDLSNYDSLMAIICSLDSTTITRLKRTWDSVSNKTKTTLDILKNTIDISKNYSTLRQKLAGSVPPCLPFVGTYLTDLTFVDAGNQATRQLLGTGQDPSTSVINFDKHVKTAKIISELQRFQVPYRLQELPELQTWIQDQFIRVRSDESGQCYVNKLYRRSCALEPREQLNAVAQPAASTMPLPPAIEALNIKTPKESKLEFLDRIRFKSSSRAGVEAPSNPTSFALL